MNLTQLRGATRGTKTSLMIQLVNVILNLIFTLSKSTKGDHLLNRRNQTKEREERHH